MNADESSHDITLDQIIEAVTRVVREAQSEGKLELMTKRIVRAEAEALLSLEPGTLNGKEYKKAINDAIANATTEDSEHGAELEPFPEPAAETDKKAKGKTGRGKEKSVKGKPGEEKGKTEKKAKGAKVAAAKTEASKEETGKRKRSSKSAKSADTIEDPDEEESPTHTKRRKGVEDSGASDPQPKPTARLSPPKLPEAPLPRPPPLHENEATAVTLATDKAAQSDSEMSVLIDEPKRGRKAKPKGESVKAKKEGKKRESKGKVELSKDEETVKRLKSLVFTCGVRKNWTKELNGLNTASAQIKRLKTILGELGMTGRMSMEQAKAIKAKRDMAQELEDVQSFADQYAEGGRVRSVKSKSATRGVSEEDEEADEAEEGTPPPNAAQSIMAFLQDQSEDEY